MIRQEQRWLRGPVFDESGEQTDEGGDCFAACLASIMELPIEGFPNFLRSGDEEGGWWGRWQRWLYEAYRHELLIWERDDWPPLETLCWWIAEVVPTKVPHSVVFYRDKFQWDPAPEEYRREYRVEDVRSAVAVFSVSSIYDREPGVWRTSDG